MNALAVKTDHLTRDFGHVRALDGLSIDVPPGHVLALLGPNGAGKTTFLKLVMGLIEPTRGQAWVLGAPARHQPADVCSRIAFVGDGHEPPRRFYRVARPLARERFRSRRRRIVMSGPW